MSDDHHPRTFPPRLTPPLMINVVGWAVYSNTFQVPFLFDDLPGISENRAIRALWPPSAVFSASNRPFAHYTFAINYALHGEQVWGYHALNLAIHLAAADCLWGIVRCTLASQSGPLRRYGDGIALAAALIWLAHPLQTQAVTYIIQRMESLMGLAYLLTLNAFIRAQDSPRPTLWYAVSIFACALGMGCKEVMVTAPLIVLWYDRAFIAASWREIFTQRKFYYAGLASSWVVLAWAVLHDSKSYGQGDVLIVENLTPWTYLVSQSGVIAHYLRLSFWPQGQCFDYGWPVAASPGEVLPQGLLILSLLALTVWAMFRHPKWSFLGGWFFLILAPSSSILPIRDLAFEHRMYLPLAAVVVGIICGAVLLVNRFTANSRQAELTTNRTLGMLAIVIVLSLGITAHLRNQVYASPERLWSDVVVKAPANPRGHFNLSNCYMNAGDWSRCLEQALKTIELAPESATAYNNAGLASANLGQSENAIGYFQTAVEKNPDLAEAWLNLGNAFFQSSPAKAEEAYRQALEAQPNYAAAHNSYGYFLLVQGRDTEAASHLQQAVQLEPSNPLAHYNLCDTLARSGKLTEATVHFRSASVLNPRWQTPPESLQKLIRTSAGRQTTP